jgi:3-oxoadipate enol-lactonase
VTPTENVYAGLAVTEWPPPTSPDDLLTVALLPSLGLSRRSWAECGPMLGAGYRTLAIDPPGQGDSAPRDHFLTIEDLALAVAEALDEAGATDVVLVGNSMGATIATALALARPDLVRALVLVGSFVIVAEPDRREWLHSRSQLFCNPDGSLKPMRREFVEGVFGGYDADRHQMMADDLASAGAALGWAMWALYSYDTATALTRIARPVLAVFGEHDRLLETSLPVIRERVPGLREAVIPDGSHLVPVDRPAELAAVLTAWLTGLGAGASVQTATSRT